MKSNRIYQLLAVSLMSYGVLSFVGTPEKVNRYDIKKPIEQIELPDILQEISGLTDLGPTTIACVQDEQGIIFIYDFKKKEITKEIRFAVDGDYEGITRVNNTLYVLRSDGLLFKVKYDGAKKLDVTRIETNIPAKNNEALCYDEKNDRLLIGSKVKSGKGANNEERHIYAFDLKTEKLLQTPAYTLKKNEIINFANKNNIELSTKKKKKSAGEMIDIKLGVSGLSIHPKTKQFYVLCAVDYLILIYNKEGELVGMEQLDKTKYPQAEGITFYENGDLLISNEGQNGKPTLLRFKNIDYNQ